MHHTAGVAMYPGPSIGGLCRVDIPASNPPFSYASGPDPTICTYVSSVRDSGFGYV